MPASSANGNVFYCKNFDQNDIASDTLCLLGSFCLILFGTKSYFSGLIAYSFSLFAFACCTLLSFVYYKRYGNWRFHRGFIAASFTFLCLFLVASGGEENTGLLWCYAFPLLSFTIVGPIYGRILITFVLTCSAVILYFPDLVWASHSYTDNTKHRFIGSIIFVSVMAHFMERSRVIAQTQSDEANEELRKLARSDELTGTYNRRGIKQKVQLELHRVVRDRTEMSLVLCDVDLFKNINDQYGHDMGDLALKHIANRMRNLVRVTDVVGRWGGEEFLILLPNTSLNEGYQLIERIRERIASEPIVVDDIKLNLSISCGICSTRFFSNFDDLIKTADKSLYDAKAHGRNCTRPSIHATG